MSLPESVYVHPTAMVDTDKIGANTRIWALVHIRKDAHIGEQCNICDQAIIDGHIGNRVTIKEGSGIALGVHVEDDVFIGPKVVTINDLNPRSPRMADASDIKGRYENEDNWMVTTRICRGATLGACVLVSPGITIGAYAMVGAGAVVVKDVPPHRLVVGHPARGIAWVCICAKKLEQSDNGELNCSDCGRRFEKSEQGIQLIGERV